MTTTKQAAKKRTPLTDAQKAAKKADAAQHFIELANKRGNRVLDALAVLGNCSNPGYEYTPDQVTKLFGVIGEAVVTCKARFDQPTRTKRGTVNIVGPDSADGEAS
jgi:hypothetical protein